MRQEFGQPIGRVIEESRDDIDEIRLRIDPEEPTVLDERVEMR